MKRVVTLGLGAGALLLSLSLAVAQGGIFGNPTPLQGPLQEEGARVQIYGRVRTVATDRFVVAVKAVQYEVLAARDEIQGGRVRVGWVVRVYGDLLDRNQVNATSVQVISREGGGPSVVGVGRGVSGRIREIDRNANTMTISTSNGNVVVAWNRDTEFIRNGATVQPREFRVGDEVRVSGRRPEGGKMTAFRVSLGDRAGYTDGARGEVVAIDRRTKEIEVDFDGEVWTVQTSRASITSRGRAAEFNDIRIDSTVMVQGQASPNRRVNATRINVVRE